MSKIDEQEKLLIEACRNGLSAEVNKTLSDVASETSDVLDELMELIDSVQSSDVAEKAEKLALFWWGIDAALQNKADCEVFFGWTDTLLEDEEGQDDE